jgi:hypothetical protein
MRVYGVGGIGIWVGIGIRNGRNGYTKWEMGVLDGNIGGNTHTERLGIIWH